MELHADVPAVLQLADEQLRCYNRANLDGFCACFAEDVVVLDADGRVELTGLPAFRACYAAMFQEFRDVKAGVHGRVCCAPHLVEYEVVRQIDRATGQITIGHLLVRYTERNGRIATVQFFRQAPAG